MDSLSAVSLAGTVVQFVHFGCSLVSESSNIYQSSTGQSQNNVELDLVARELSLLCAAFQNDRPSQESGAIFKLALACKAVADDLVVMVSRMREKNGQHNKWSSFRQALKSVLKSGELKDLCNRLERLRSQMNTAMLAEFGQNLIRVEHMLQVILTERMSWRSLGLSNTSCNKENMEPHHILRQIIDDVGIFAHPSTPFTTLSQETAKDLLNSEHVQKLIKSSTALVREQKVLKSLRFRSMNIRETNISEAHSETFRWILCSNGSDSSGPLSTIGVDPKFVEWLQASEDIFWIAGKPGSGKSTLMKYILSDPRTCHNLQIWAGNKQLYVAKYFFWHRGTEMQRSEQGLLRSLLYAIFEAAPGLASEICPSRTKPNPGSWITVELKETLSRLAHTQIEHSKFCFFIDGLDELSGDTHALIELLQDLSRSPNFKICLASRPWLEFEDAFGQRPNHRLNLQDLTKPDIERYTRQTLETSTRWLSSREKQQFDGIIDEVVEKSQGVFLWVVLVVRSLRDGLTNNDTISILDRRLRSFPADLEPFFEALIQSVDSVYRNVMAKTFLVHLVSDEYRGLPLVVHAFLEEKFDYTLEIPLQEPFSKETIFTHQAHMRRRINGRYKGLLEIGSSNSPDIYSEYSYTVVDFLHRSVRDFLNTITMQKLLFSEVGSDFSAEFQLGRLHLAHLKTTPELFRRNFQYHGWSYHSTVLENIFLLSQFYQSKTGRCDYQMLDGLRKILEARDIVDSEAKYLSLLALHGMTAYIRRYLKGVEKGPSKWLDFSPVLLLLGYYDWRQCMSPGWEDSLPYLDNTERDIFATSEEYIQTTRLFLDAGVDPRNDSQEISSWKYLIYLVTSTTDSKEAREFTWTTRKSLGPLLDMCMEYGATFADLTTGEDGRACVESLVHALATNMKSDHSVSAKDVLIKLLQKGFNPSQTHEGLDNSSFFSIFLEELISTTLWRELDLGGEAADIINLCLRHGADTRDPKLLALLEGHYFFLGEKQEILRVLKELSSRKGRREKRKRKRERMSSGNTKRKHEKSRR